jgi:hypothetical protein
MKRWALIKDPNNFGPHSGTLVVFFGPGYFPNRSNFLRVTKFNQYGETLDL